LYYIGDDVILASFFGRTHFSRRYTPYYACYAFTIGVPSFCCFTRKGAKYMTQTQLVKLLADDCEVSRKVSKQLLDGLAATAIKEVRKAGSFVLPGLGKLVRVDRKARVGRNPATGETINIPAKKVVKFRVAKAVKDAIVPPKGKKVAAS
jgi:DNA-binding protein HU-beta